MDKSPFNKLPAELRLEIYTLALSQPGPIDVNVDHNGVWRLVWRYRKLHLLDLTFTCRVIRQERLPVFFENETFSFRVDVDNYFTACPTQTPIESPDAEEYGRFLRLIGRRNASAIKAVEFWLGVFDDETNESAKKAWWKAAKLLTAKFVDDDLSKDCSIRASFLLIFDDGHKRCTSNPLLESSFEGELEPIVPTRNEEATRKAINEEADIKLKEIEAHMECDSRQCQIVRICALLKRDVA